MLKESFILNNANITDLEVIYGQILASPSAVKHYRDLIKIYQKLNMPYEAEAFTQLISDISSDNSKRPENRPAT